jgi:Holliday junction DNA helicase RuvA
MIYTLRGTPTILRKNFVVLEMGGVGYKVFVTEEVIKQLALNTEASLFVYHHVREDDECLYGFPTEAERTMFELLLSVSGVGPKSALGILNVAPVDKLRLAIHEGKAELLTRVSGIGRKIAERIIIELQTKVEMTEGGMNAAQVESDMDVESALMNLGYTKNSVRDALRQVDPTLQNLGERLKAALRILKK